MAKAPMYAQGLHCDGPQDFICGRCGDVLVTARSVIAEITFEAGGAVHLDDAEHWCSPEVDVPHLLVVLPTGVAAAMEASLPV